MKKTTAILFSAALLLCNCFNAKAQDVDGISLWDKCTKEQLIEKYGQPVKYYSQEPDFPEDGEGQTESIYFKDAYFRLEGNKVTEFAIKTTKPHAMTKYVKNGIGIGDSEEVLKGLEKYFFEKTENNDSRIEYKYLFTENEDMFFVTTKNGVITDIYACAITI